MSKVKDKVGDGMNMDLKKLDPFARRLKACVDGFYKAMEENDGNAASEHLNGLMAAASQLQKGVDTAIYKAEERVAMGPNEIFAGGAPVIKVAPDRYVHAPTDRVLPGHIRTSRVGPQNRRLTGNRLY